MTAGDTSEDPVSFDQDAQRPDGSWARFVQFRNVVVDVPSGLLSVPVAEGLNIAALPQDRHYPDLRAHWIELEAIEQMRAPGFVRDKDHAFHDALSPIEDLPQDVQKIINTMRGYGVLRGTIRVVALGSQVLSLEEEGTAPQAEIDAARRHASVAMLELTAFVSAGMSYDDAVATVTGYVSTVAANWDRLAAAYNTAAEQERDAAHNVQSPADSPEDVFRKSLGPVRDLPPALQVVITLDHGYQILRVVTEAVALAITADNDLQHPEHNGADPEVVAETLRKGEARKTAVSLLLDDAMHLVGGPRRLASGIVGEVMLAVHKHYPLVQAAYSAAFGTGAESAAEVRQLGDEGPALGDGPGRSGASL